MSETENNQQIKETENDPIENRENNSKVLNLWKSIPRFVKIIAGIAILIAIYHTFVLPDIRYFVHSDITDKSSAEDIGQMAVYESEELNYTMSYLTSLFVTHEARRETFREGIDNRSIDEFVTAKMNFTEKVDFIDLEFNMDVLRVVQNFVDSLLISFKNKKSITITQYVPDDPKLQVGYNMFRFKSDSISADENSAEESRRHVVDEITRDMAKYLYQMETNCKEQLCINDIPKKKLAIDYIRNGIDILQREAASIYCDDSDNIKCISRAEEILKMSIEEDREQTIGYIGIALTNIRKAELLSKTEHALKTSNALIDAAYYVEKAKSNSEFFKELLKDRSIFDYFISKEKQREISVNEEFIERIGEYGRARDNYLKGNWKVAKGGYSQIRKVAPEWLLPIIEAQIIDIDRELNNGVTTREMVVRLEKLNGKMDDVRHGSMMAQYLSSMANAQDSDYSRAVEIYENILIKMKPGPASDTVLLQQAEVEKKLNRVQRWHEIYKLISEKYKNANCTEDKVTVFIRLAIYFAENKEYTTAKNYMLKVFNTDEKYFKIKLNKAITEMPDYAIWRSQIDLPNDSQQEDHKC